MPKKSYTAEEMKVRRDNGFGLDKMPVDKARKIQSKGGKVSGEVKRTNKKIKETLEFILSLPVNDPKVKESLKKIGIESDYMTQQTLGCLATVKRWQKTGDPTAMAVVRDSAGQKEADKLDITNPVQIKIEDEFS